MNKLTNAVDRFCARHPHFGIPNLMKFIVAGTVLVYLLDAFSRGAASALLYFSTGRLLEVWRMVTYIFVSNFDAFSLILSLYLYYFIGNVLEREWGTAKFTLYYLSGVLLTVVATILVSLLPGVGTLTQAGSFYLNMSMFFAFAILYPDMQLMLFFIIPIKMKWLALADGFVFLVGIIRSLAAGNWAGVVVPIVALLNFAVFFAPNFSSLVERKRYQHSRQATHFRKVTHKADQEKSSKGYHHKCSVCGRTDAEFPNLAFRYCSRCAGYHCFCEEHIFNHVHFTE